MDERQFVRHETLSRQTTFSLPLISILPYT